MSHGRAAEPAPRGEGDGALPPNPAVELSRNMLLAQDDSRMPGVHLVVDGIAESLKDGSVDAGYLNRGDDDDEPWSNL